MSSPSKKIPGKLRPLPRNAQEGALQRAAITLNGNLTPAAQDDGLGQAQGAKCSGGGYGANCVRSTLRETASLDVPSASSAAEQQQKDKKAKNRSEDGEKSSRDAENASAVEQQQKEEKAKNRSEDEKKRSRDAENAALDKQLRYPISATLGAKINHAVIKAKFDEFSGADGGMSIYHLKLLLKSHKEYSDINEEQLANTMNFLSGLGGQTHPNHVSLEQFQRAVIFLSLCLSTLCVSLSLARALAHCF